jgi:hypothetical protein
LERQIIDAKAMLGEIGSAADVESRPMVVCNRCAWHLGDESVVACNVSFDKKTGKTVKKCDRCTGAKGDCVQV